MMLEESLIHSFLTLSYSEANFFKRSLSIAKSLISFYGEQKYKKDLGDIENFCAFILRTKSGRNFAVSYHVLEQAFLKNATQSPDTPINFEITNFDGYTESFELSLADVVNYLYILHDKMLNVVIALARDHGIALGDISGTGSEEPIISPLTNLPVPAIKPSGNFILEPL
jgi:hypothetical protein